MTKQVFAIHKSTLEFIESHVRIFYKKIRKKGMYRSTSQTKELHIKIKNSITQKFGKSKKNRGIKPRLQLDRSIILRHIPERNMWKMYIKNSYYVGNSIEVEKVHSGRYGKKIPVSEKVKPTTETVQKVNFRNKVKKLRRIIQNNFTEDDWHLVLTYRKDNRPEMEEAKKILRSFHGKMKRRYQKNGDEYKWICVTEYRTTAIHHHLVVNNTEDLIRILKECWTYGHINLTPLYEDMDVAGLAEYLLKETKDTTQKKKFGGISQPPCLFSVQKFKTGEKRDRGNRCKGLEKRAKANQGVLHRQGFRFGRG